MSNTGNSKLKLLLILELLRQYSDEDHPVTSSELCNLLAERGIISERKSIYRDISVLSKFGIDVIRAHSPKPGFFIAGRKFELPEVRLLMDAVLTAPFITSKKTVELTEKLKSLLSCYQAESVTKQIFIDQRIKFDNEEIYYSIDSINRAIAANRQICFVYHHKSIVDHKIRFDNGRKFTISPYALIWADDKYYLAGNYDKYDSVSNYRLDRIKHVEITNLKSRPFSEVSPYLDHFDAADYLRKNFNMYNGEKELIELRCSNKILEAVADKFGDDTEYCCHDENGFTVRAHVNVSEGLIEWLLQYGSNILVQSPRHLREEIICRIEQMESAYQANQKTYAR